MKVSKGILLLGVFVMATISIISFATINKNIAIGDIVSVEENKHILINELKQNYNFENSDVEELKFYRNGIFQEKEKAIRVKKDIFIRIDYLKRKYLISYGGFGSDYLFPINTASDIYYFRMFSKYFANSKGIEKNFEAAPILYDNEIYLPIEMIGIFEKQLGYVITLQTQGDSIFYFLSRALGHAGSIFRINTNSHRMSFSNISESLNYDMNKEIADEIQSIRQCKESNILFAKGKTRSFLLTCDKEKVNVYKEYNLDVELSYTGDTLYWINDDVINFYLINKNVQYQIESKYFRHDISDYILGVQNLQIHSFIKHKDSYTVRVMRNDKVIAFTGKNDSTKVKRIDGEESISKNDSVDKRLVLDDESDIVGKIAESEDGKIACYLYRDRKNSNIINLAVNKKNKRMEEVTLSTIFSKVDSKWSIGFLDSNQIFITCEGGFVLYNLKSGDSFFQSSDGYKGLCLIK